MAILRYVGYYPNLKVELSQGEFAGKDYSLEFLFTKFSFGEKKTGQRLPEFSVTYILLTGRKQHLPKIRCTFTDDQ
jgi:hypothetical protein